MSISSIGQTHAPLFQQANVDQIKVSSVFKRVLSSGLFLATAATALTAYTVVLLLSVPNVPVFLFAALLGTCGGAVYSHAKQLVYEVSILPGIIANDIAPKRYPWYQEICEGIYLGAIPLKNRNHHKELKSQGFDAVLSLLEPFELETDSLLSEPVRHADWQKLGMETCLIETADFLPMSVEDIDRAVNFLLEKINQGKKSYVHCKAGRGRSATVVIALLLKRGNFKTVDEAIRYVKGIRPVINLNQRQKAALQKYLDKINHAH